MYRRFLFISMLSLFLLMVFSGCKKQEVNFSSQPGDTIVLNADFMFDNSPYTKSLDELARMVAFGMRDKDFRSFLKEEALKQIDGDYDVIYEYSKSKKVKEDEDLESYLRRLSGVYFGKSSKLEKLISEVKDFQLSVPVHCSEWDVESYEPLVTYIPASFDEKTFKYVKAYDSQGRVYALSLDKAPTRPVVVLGSCESMDMVRRGKVVPTGDDRSVELPPIDTTGWNNGGGGSMSVREDGMTEYLSWIQIEDLSVIEPWVQGKPELLFKIYSPLFGDFIAAQFVPLGTTTRNGIEKGVYINVPIFSWDWNLYGPFYRMHWLEIDNFGSTITHTYKVSVSYEGLTLSRSYSISYKLADKNLEFKPVKIMI